MACFTQDKLNSDDVSVCMSINLMLGTKKLTNQLFLYITGNGQTFNFDYGKIICILDSSFELDFLEAFHVHKKHKNVVNCDLAFSILSNLD